MTTYHQLIPGGTMNLLQRFHWPLLAIDLVLACALGAVQVFTTGAPSWVGPVGLAVLGVLNAAVAKTDRQFAQEINAAAYELGQVAPNTPIDAIAKAVAGLLVTSPDVPVVAAVASQPVAPVPVVAPLNVVVPTPQPAPQDGRPA